MEAAPIESLGCAQPRKVDGFPESSPRKTKPVCALSCLSVASQNVGVMSPQVSVDDAVHQRAQVAIRHSQAVLSLARVGRAVKHATATLDLGVRVQSFGPFSATQSAACATVDACGDMITKHLEELPTLLPRTRVASTRVLLAAGIMSVQLFARTARITTPRTTFTLRYTSPALVPIVRRLTRAPDAYALASALHRRILGPRALPLLAHAAHLTRVEVSAAFTTQHTAHNQAILRAYTHSIRDMHYRAQAERARIVVANARHERKLTVQARRKVARALGLDIRSARRAARNSRRKHAAAVRQRRNSLERQARAAAARQHARLLRAHADITSRPRLSGGAPPAHIAVSAEGQMPVWGMVRHGRAVPNLNYITVGRQISCQFAARTDVCVQNAEGRRFIHPINDVLADLYTNRPNDMPHLGGRYFPVCRDVALVRHDRHPVGRNTCFYDAILANVPPIYFGLVDAVSGLDLRHCMLERLAPRFRDHARRIMTIHRANFMFGADAAQRPPFAEHEVEGLSAIDYATRTDGIALDVNDDAQVAAWFTRARAMEVPQTLEVLLAASVLQIHVSIRHFDDDGSGIRRDLSITGFGVGPIAMMRLADEHYEPVAPRLDRRGVAQREPRLRSPIAITVLPDAPEVVSLPAAVEIIPQAPAISDPGETLSGAAPSTPTPPVVVATPAPPPSAPVAAPVAVPVLASSPTEQPNASPCPAATASQHVASDDPPRLDLAPAGVRWHRSTRDVLRIENGTVTLPLPPMPATESNPIPIEGEWVRYDVDTGCVPYARIVVAVCTLRPVMVDWQDASNQRVDNADGFCFPCDAGEVCIVRRSRDWRAVLMRVFFALLRAQTASLLLRVLPFVPCPFWLVIALNVGTVVVTLFVDHAESLFADGDPGIVALVHVDIHAQHVAPIVRRTWWTNFVMRCTGLARRATQTRVFPARTHFHDNARVSQPVQAFIDQSYCGVDANLATILPYPELICEALNSSSSANATNEELTAKVSVLIRRELAKGTFAGLTHDPATFLQLRNGLYEAYAMGRAVAAGYARVAGPPRTIVIPGMSNGTDGFRRPDTLKPQCKGLFITRPDFEVRRTHYARLESMPLTPQIHQFAAYPGDDTDGFDEPLELEEAFDDNHYYFKPQRKRNCRRCLTWCKIGIRKLRHAIVTKAQELTELRSLTGGSSDDDDFGLSDVMANLHLVDSQHADYREVHARGSLPDNHSLRILGAQRDAGESIRRYSAFRKNGELLWDPMPLRDLPICRPYVAVGDDQWLQCMSYERYPCDARRVAHEHSVLQDLDWNIHGFGCTYRQLRSWEFERSAPKEVVTRITLNCSAPPGAVLGTSWGTVPSRGIFFSIYRSTLAPFRITDFDDDLEPEPRYAHRVNLFPGDPDVSIQPWLDGRPIYVHCGMLTENFAFRPLNPGTERDLEALFNNLERIAFHLEPELATLRASRFRQYPVHIDNETNIWRPLTQLRNLTGGGRCEGCGEASQGRHRCPAFGTFHSCGLMMVRVTQPTTHVYCPKCHNTDHARRALSHLLSTEVDTSWRHGRPWAARCLPFACPTREARKEACPDPAVKFRMIDGDVVALFPEPRKFAPQLVAIGFVNRMPFVTRVSHASVRSTLLGRALVSPRPAPCIDELEQYAARFIADVREVRGMEKIRATNFAEWNARFPRGKQQAHFRARDAIVRGDFDSRWFERKFFLKFEKLAKNLADGDYAGRAISAVSAEAQVALGPLMHAFGLFLKNWWSVRNAANMRSTTPVIYASGQSGEHIGDALHDLEKQGYINVVSFDYERFDSGFQVKHLRTSHAVFHALLDFDSARGNISRHALNAQLHSKARFMIGHTTVASFEFDGRRNSGDSNTSCENSLMNGLVMQRACELAGVEAVVVVCGDDTMILSRLPLDHQISRLRQHIAEVGFSVTGGPEPGIVGARFLGSVVTRVYDDTGRERRLLVPDARRALCKLGWSLEWREAYLDWSRGVALAYRDLCSAVPVLSNYIQAVLRSTPCHRSDAAIMRMARRARDAPQILRCAGMSYRPRPHPMAMHDFCAAYGVPEYAVKSLCDQLDAVEVLPVLIEAAGCQGLFEEC